MLPLGFIIFPYIIVLFKQISIQKKIYDYFYFGFFYGLGFLLVFLSWIQNPFFTNDTTKNYAIIALFLPIFLSFFFGIGFVFFKYIKKIYYFSLFNYIVKKNFNSKKNIWLFLFRIFLWIRFFISFFILDSESFFYKWYNKKLCSIFIIVANIFILIFWNRFYFFQIYK